MPRLTPNLAFLAPCLLLLVACGDDEGGGAAVPDDYRFESAFSPGESSVNHVGQTTRQILLEDLGAEMERLSDGVLDGSIPTEQVDEPGEVVARLNAFFREGSAALGSRPLPALVAEGDQTCQTTYADLGDANLVGKVAGEDDVTDFRDWDGDDEGSAGVAFRGALDVANLADGPGSPDTPVGMIDALFATFEAQVRACALSPGDCPTDAAGDELPLYVTPEGLDLAELVSKSLISAIQFHQSADDYLDDDVEGKGLLAGHEEPRGDGAPDTTLEHAWDEAFGYFGAAADFADYTDEEIDGRGGRPGWENGYHDADGDGCIDVFTELNFASAGYAGRFDRLSATGTDLTGETFRPLVEGRALLARTAGAPLAQSDAAALRSIRDEAEASWERVLGAAAIYYLNLTLDDLDACGEADYALADHAKHWGELKGFALAFQFSPRSPFTAGSADFDALHDRIGGAPVLCDGDVGGARTDLVAARDAIRDAFGFDAADAEAW